VSARLLLSGIGHDTARAWTAPKDGVVDISAQAIPLGTGSQAVITITKNGQPIWGPQVMDGTANPLDTSVANVAVSAGDVIRFEMQGGAAISFQNLLQWDPDLRYQGDPPPPPPDQPVTASWTFTGSQVTWYAELGPDHGAAQVLIDGQPDTAVNLYGPSSGDWSVPVYVKTFPVAGTHTITIQALPDLDGTSVDVDGFQAATATPAVTEDTSPEVGYTGHGWVAQPAAAASGGSVTASSAAGDTVSVGFSGRSVTWVGRTCAACGEADVYLDGKYVTRIDTYGYRGPQVWQAGLFQHSWARPGWHTLKIVVDGTQNLSSTGAEVDVDSFQVGTG
jgi:hypothetical protein